MLGLDLDEPIEQVVSKLVKHGVRMKGEIVNDKPGRFAHFEDPDGNEIYIWEATHNGVGDTEPIYASAR